MIVNGSLSAFQRKAGCRNYLIFNAINGLSYICLGEMVIILFAVRLNTPNFCIAAIGSFFFLANFCMPLGKMLVAKVGGARTLAICWILRNVSALTVAAAPLMALIHPSVGIAVIMLGTFGFYSCRSAGIAASQPLIGEVTTPENRGKVASAIARVFNISAMVMLGIIIVILKLNPNTWVFEAIIIMGAIMGFASAFVISKVDETEVLRDSARQPILADMKLTLKKPMRQKQLLANCIINAAIALTIPISMLALKKGYGISDGDALIFAILQYAGGIATSYLISLLAEETGPRPLAIVFYFSTIILCLLWSIGPDSFKWYYSASVFFLAGGAQLGTGISMTHYFLITVPVKERVAASLTISALSGVVAGLVGIVVGGGLLKYLGSVQLTPIDMFKLYFLIIAGLLLVGLFFVSRLEPKADWHVSEVLGLAFAPRDVLALFSLYGLKQDDSPEKDLENIDRLLDIKSGLTEKALLAYLESPKFLLRGRALNALREISFGDQAAAAILEELEVGEFTTASIAAQIAGERKFIKAIPLLRKHLLSKDFYLQSKAMTALVQLKDSFSYSTIKQIFKDTDNPRIMVHGAVALAEIADDESFRLLLNKSVTDGIPYKVLCEIIYSIARLTGCGDDIYQFLKFYNKDRPRALSILDEMNPPDCEVDGFCTVDKQLAHDIENGTAPQSLIIDKLMGYYSASTEIRKRDIVNFLRANREKMFPLELLLCLGQLLNNRKKTMN